MAVKSELGARVVAREAAEDLGDFLRTGSAGGVANNEPADFSAHAQGSDLVEVVQAPLPEIGVAVLAVFATAEIGIHGVLKVHNHFKVIVLQEGDGLAGHEQVFFRRCLQGPCDVKKPGFDDDDGNGDVLLVADDELRVGPVLHFGSTAAGPPEQSQLHCPGVDGRKGAREIADKLVGAGEADLGIGNAK